MNTYILLIIAYLLGSIPSSLLIGKIFHGIDIREHGSGNMGTTNTVRVLGKKTGFIVFFMDYVKGMLVLGLVYHGVINPSIDIHPLWYGVASIFGHTASIFAKFKGGKAVATSAGVVTVISPLIFVSGISSFFIILFITGYVSLGSTAAAIVALVLTLIFIDDTVIVIFYSAIFTFILFKHRTNYVRLLNGTESNFKKRKK